MTKIKQHKIAMYLTVTSTLRTLAAEGKRDRAVRFVVATALLLTAPCWWAVQLVSADQTNVLVRRLPPPVPPQNVQPMPQDQTEDQMYMAVDGAASTYLPLISPGGHGSWQLVKIVTDSASGFYAAGPEAPLVVSGSYTIITSYGKIATKPAGRYRWTRRAGYANANRPMRDDPESLWFQSNLFSCDMIAGDMRSATRYILCVLHEDTEGQGKFTDVHCVPKGWQQYVVPAVTYLRGHANLADLSAVAKNQAKIEALLRDPNPYLALTAFQVLAAGNVLSTVDVSTALSNPDAIFEAACMGVSRMYLWQDQANNEQWLLDAVGSLSTMSQLQAVAISGETSDPADMAMYGGGDVDEPQRPASSKNPNSEKDFVLVLRAVKARMAAIDPSGSRSDPQWMAIDSELKLAGINPMTFKLGNPN